METEQLKRTLVKLRADLAANGTNDPELQDMLRVLDADIHRLLDKEAHLSSDASSLSTRTQEISARFAAEHPRLEPVLRELGAILERIGI